MFSPELCLNIGQEELKLVRERTDSVAGPWPCSVSQQSHNPRKCTAVQKPMGEGWLAAEKFLNHSLALKMNVKSARDVSSQCRFSCFPLCLA